MQEWMELESRVHLHTFKRVPVVLVRGEGCRVWDTEGREYLDLVGGWAVDSLGHCPPAVVDALHKQAQTLIQVSSQFYTIPQLELARLLVDNSPCDRVFFGNSGAEANEGALKLARRWGKRERGGAFGVISTHRRLPRPHPGDGRGHREAGLPGAVHPPAGGLRERAPGTTWRPSSAPPRTTRWP